VLNPGFKFEKLVTGKPHKVSFYQNIDELDFVELPFDNRDDTQANSTAWMNRHPLIATPNVVVPDVLRRDLHSFPDFAFELQNVLQPAECEFLIEMGESLGFDRNLDKYGGRLRQNGAIEWLADKSFCDLLWHRMSNYFPERLKNRNAAGVNNVMRIYRYDPGDVFLRHYDLSSTLAAVDDGVVRFEGKRKSISLVSVLIYLNEDFTGGETVLYPARQRIDRSDRTTPAPEPISVVPVRGNAVCFRHGRGNRPMRHSGAKIIVGRKYILKTDISFMHQR
jgi:prolyl 4-hydroxylase